tara:strand:- start:100 stop:411 length:312 start_codon:yes stop_codon:yes gene_type:complete
MADNSGITLPASGSYSLIKPALLTEARWTAVVSGSSLKDTWESGDASEIHSYVVIGTSGSTYGGLHIQQALDQFVAQASRSQYDLSGSLLWKDNTAKHPFIDR